MHPHLTTFLFSVAFRAMIALANQTGQEMSSQVDSDFWMGVTALEKCPLLLAMEEVEETPLRI